ncbi:hypothetical protein NHX12_020600 [Muraenolepis orangiensis]|uniref:Uncharacterized protein n=1 Tax=Muraenolepis orangiensis TaxID=630683 RepID=A0A9Q0IVB0_9TELE|nr:hypothetical protein NHX12_020600 [Muraenolepis orangiensis]
MRPGLVRFTLRPQGGARLHIPVNDNISTGDKTPTLLSYRFSSSRKPTGLGQVDPVSGRILEISRDMSVSDLQGARRPTVF